MKAVQVSQARQDLTEECGRIQTSPIEGGALHILEGDTKAMQSDLARKQSPSSSVKSISPLGYHLKHSQGFQLKVLNYIFFLNMQPGF